MIYTIGLTRRCWYLFGLHIVPHTAPRTGPGLYRLHDKCYVLISLSFHSKLACPKWQSQVKTCGEVYNYGHILFSV